MVLMCDIPESSFRKEDSPLPPMTDTVNGLPDLAFFKKACTRLPVP